MLEELEYALFSIDNFELYRGFTMEGGEMKFVYNHVVVHGNKDKISVFYDFDEMKVTKQLKYVSKHNTLKTFNLVSSAMNYMKYLSNITTDIRYEMYHYFMYKLKELEILYKILQFNTVNNLTIEEMMLRCDIGGLTIKNKEIKYNFVIIFRNDYKCELSFYPEKPLWDEGKDCPETEIDKIIEYILNLKVDNYDDIPLKES